MYDPEGPRASSLLRRFVLLSSLALVLVAVCVELVITHAGNQLTLPALVVALGSVWFLLIWTMRTASVRLRRQAEELTALSEIDALTGLANRRGMASWLQGAGGRRLALLVLDLDGFKAINTVRGFVHGDELLTAAGTALKGVSGDMLVARIGGDEFVVLADVADEVAAKELATTVQSALGAVRVDGRRLTAALGIALYPDDTTDATNLMRLASAALAAAKGVPGAVRRYEPGLEARLRAIAEQRKEIVAVLSDPDQLKPVFQPIVSLRSGSVVAYEMLSRLSGESRGTAEWFAQAQRVGLGPELQAVAPRAALEAPGRPKDAVLAVNLSPSALQHPDVLAALPDDLSELLIEVTEDELVREYERLAPVLSDLRARGARIAVDDAGAGYAGLRQLIGLRPDIIKLDRDLITGIEHDSLRSALVESLARFANAAGALVCAEGVETLSQLKRLSTLDVALVQGYALARPSAAWPELKPEAAALCRSMLSNPITGPGAHVATSALPQTEELLGELADVRSLDALPHMVGRFADLVGCEEVALSLLDERTDQLLTISQSSWRATEDVYDLADYPATRAVLAGGAGLQVLASDPLADPNELAVLSQSPYRSVLLTPLRAHGETLGLIEWYRTEERAWSAHDVLRSRVVAHQLSSVLSALLRSGRGTPRLPAALPLPPR